MSALFDAGTKPEVRQQMLRMPDEVVAHSGRALCQGLENVLGVAHDTLRLQPVPREGEPMSARPRSRSGPARPGLMAHHGREPTTASCRRRPPKQRYCVQRRYRDGRRRHVRDQQRCGRIRNTPSVSTLRLPRARRFGDLCPLEALSEELLMNRAWRAMTFRLRLAVPSTIIRSRAAL